jgi:prevent-host-death family protein
MHEIGVRELKTRASEIVRNVRRRRTRYVITYRGRPVGVLGPLEGNESTTTSSAAEASAVWDELTRLGQDIARGWPANKASADVLSEMRR